MNGAGPRGYAWLFWWALAVIAIPTIQYSLLGRISASSLSRLAALEDWLLLLAPAVVTLAGAVFTYLVRIRVTALSVRLHVTVWGALITAFALAGSFVISARRLLAGAT